MRTYNLMIAVVAIGVASATVLPFALGIGGFGPTHVVVARVNRLYVDTSSDGNRSSHYMVSTDAGSFEVDNGILLGMWNADEVYGALRDGRTYKFTTKGNKVVGMFFQEYPYIVSAEQIK